MGQSPSQTMAWPENMCPNKYAIPHCSSQAGLRKKAARSAETKVPNPCKCLTLDGPATAPGGLACPLQLSSLSTRIHTLLIFCPSSPPHRSSQSQQAHLKPALRSNGEKLWPELLTRACIRTKPSLALNILHSLIRFSDYRGAFQADCI